MDDYANEVINIISLNLDLFISLTEALYGEIWRFTSSFDSKKIAFYFRQTGNNFFSGLKTWRLLLNHP